MPMTGGFSETKPMTEEVRQIAVHVQPELEGKAGRKFDKYEPVSFSSQTVAGTNFLIKVDVGQAEFAHVKVFRSLPHAGSALSVSAHQLGKTADDPLTPIPM